MPKGIRADGKPSPLKGRARLPEIKEKIAGPRYSYNVGSANPNFHRPRSAEERKRISERTKLGMTSEVCQRISEKAKLIIGSQRYNWKGGYSKEYPQEYFDLRPIIRRRDGFKCQECGTIAHGSIVGKIDIHHIDGNHENNSPDNLVVLCRGCHKTAEANLRARKVVMEG